MHFCLERRPIVQSCVNVAAQPSGFPMMQVQKSLTLWWRSSWGFGNEHGIFLFRYNTHQYIHICSILQCRPLIAECVRLKIFDTLLTFTLITSKQPSYTQWLYASSHILSFEIECCVCMWYLLHPGVLLPLYFWSTAIHAILVRDDLAQSHCLAFGRHFTACRPFHHLLVNMARLPPLALFSPFSLISMTHHEQFQIFQPSARCRWGELWSWIHGWMQDDGHHWDIFVMSTDCSL